MTINAGDDDDTIYGGFSNNAIINAGGGNNYISPQIRNASITAGDGNDSIDTRVGNITIDAGDGNNLIRSDGYDSIDAEGLVSIRTGLGDDTVEINNGRKVNVNLGDGNNSVYAESYYNYHGTPYDAEISIVSGTGNDYFSVFSKSNSTISIDAGAGSDTITLSAWSDTSLNAVIVDMGEGDDSIADIFSNLTLKGGAGNDSIDPYGGYDSSDSVKNVSIDAGDGDDYFYVKKSLQNSTVEMGAGNDSIVNWNSGNLLFRNVFFSFGTGDDSFSTDSSIESATFDMGDGNDSIMAWNSTVKDVSIAAGAGVDSIVFSNATNLTVDGGADDDNIYITSSSSVSVDGGAGNDSLYVGGSHVTINGGAGNDTLIASAENATLDGEADNDYLINYSTKTMMIGGDGNDTLRNEVEGKYTASKKQDDSTLDAGDGNDTLYNGNYQNVSMSGGAGDDLITNNGEKATINAGAGDDYISLTSTAMDNLIEYAHGDGSDTIEGFNSSSTLTVSGDDEILTVKSGSDVLVTVGDKTILLKGAANVSTINIAGEGFNPKKIIGTDDKNSIDNALDDATIQAKGDDDTIKSFGARASIDAGAGNDNIHSAGTNATISGSAGNDFVTLATSAANNLIVYNDGDDTDTVSGFNVTSTLQIGNGDTDTYTRSIVNRNDILISLRSGGSVLLVGAATLDNVNIAGREVDSLFFMGTDDADNFDNRQANATIDALGGNDLITNDGKNVSVNAGDGNDTIKNGSSYSRSSVGAGSTLLSGDGDDSIVNYSNSVSIDGGEGSDTYSTLKSDADVVVYVGEETILLKGAASVSAVNVLGDEVIQTFVTLTEDADTYTNDHADVTVSALGGDDEITNNGANASISGGDGDDTLINTGDGATLDGDAGNDSISNAAVNAVLNGGAGNDTVEGFNEDDTLQIGDGTEIYTLRTSGNNIIVSAGTAGSVILKDAATLANLNIAGEEYNSLRVKLSDYPDNYTNNFANMTVLAFGGNDTITNEGANVLIDGGAGNDTIISRAGDNSTLLGGEGNDFIYNQGQSVTIDGGDGNDTIHTNAIYNSVFGGEGDDVISLEASSNVTATLNGGKGNDTIYGKFNSQDPQILFEYSAGDGNDEIHEFNAGDTLKIGDGTATYYSATVGNDVVVYAGEGSVVLKGAASLASINIAGVETVPAVTGTAGDDMIQVSDNGSQVTSGDGNDTIKVGANVTSFTVTDFSAGDVIELNSSVEAITAEDDSIVAGNVTIGGVTAANEDFALTLDEGTVAYVKTSSAGAKLSDDGKTITFASVATETLLTIDGLDADLTDDALTAGVTVDGNKVILSADVLNQTTVTLTTDGDYALELDAEVPTVTDVEKSWTLDGTTATLHDAGKSAGYEVTNAKTVTYTPEVVGENLLTVTGVAGNLSADELSENLTLNGNVLTVKRNAVGDNFSVPAGYKVVFAAGDYDGLSYVGTDGKDTVEVRGTGLSLDLGAGNDTVTSSVTGGGNIYLFDATSGKDVIVGFGDGDTIKITDGAQVTASVKGHDIIVKAGTATMTLKDAADGTQVKIVDADNATLLDQTFFANRIVEGDKVLLNASYNKNTYTTDEDFPNVDASAVSKKLTLTGGADDNEIIGGKGADLINGSAGSNTLTGGRGNDTFAYGGGSDTITDYGTGSDKISLGTSLSAYEIDDDGNLILKVNGGSVTILDGVDKKVTLLDDRTTSLVFTRDGIWNATKTAVTLTAETSEFAADDSELVTIDGSASDGISIVGNAKNNKIFGGDGSDILNGSAGNDTLTGNGGADVFVFESGKDVVADYSVGDKISLGAAVTSESVNNRGDVVLKFDTNSLTIKNVGDTDGLAVTFTGDGGDTVKTYFSEKIVTNDGVTLLSSFAGTYAEDAANPIVDASAVGKKITLTGDDTISDYGNGSDKISLGADATNFRFDNDDLIIVFADGSLTIKDAVDKKISFIEGGQTRVNIFAAEGIFDGKQTAVTLNATTTAFNAADFGKLVTIDGGLATNAIEIVGNAKNNKIFAGDNGSTLTGGAGNDSLWGGDGSDTFIYDGGKDVIFGFGNGDALQLGDEFTVAVIGETISFKVGTTAKAVTLKNYSATSFNVDGNNYEIDNGAFVRK